MKYIKKNHEPVELTEFKKKRNENWEPTYDGLDSDVKITLHNSLLEEQGSICCYCEIEVRKENSHIEHIKPQNPDKYPEEQLIYENLLCSCGNQSSTHCGHKKGEWYEGDRFISPLSPECEEKIVYSSSGHLKSVDGSDEAANCTIQILNFNDYDLLMTRKTVVETYEGFSEDEIRSTLINENGSFHQFYISIVQYYDL